MSMKRITDGSTFRGSKPTLASLGSEAGESSRNLRHNRLMRKHHTFKKKIQNDLLLEVTVESSQAPASSVHGSETSRTSRQSGTTSYRRRKL